MRILIADDEYLARSSLLSMLEELHLPLEFIDEATNGEEMVALVSQSFPDVAFVDIRMPKLNGLEAIKYAEKISPHTRWYVLTGFSEFEYAHEAIRLGVSGYLLKPVNPEELRRILTEFIEENRKQKTAQNKQFEHELMTLHYGLTSLEFQKPDSYLLAAQFMGAIICIDSYLPEKVKAERLSEFYQAVQVSIEDCIDHHNRIALFVLPSGELTTVGAWEPAHDCVAKSYVRKYFKAIEQILHQSSDKDLVITALVSKECRTYQELQSSLERLQEIASLRVVDGIGKRLDITLLNQQAQNPGLLPMCNLVITLCHCFQEGNYLTYMKALQDLENELSKSSNPGKHVSRQAVSDFINRSIHCQLDPGLDLMHWFTVLQKYGEQLLKGTPKVEILSPDMIQQVTSYINENYMFDVGIGQIAEQFHITPNYLSALFHKKTGTNFMSYLKWVRMLKAKELLTDPNIQIQQVAEQVGYSSTRHFARLFTEQFGCLPSEYRDNFKKR